MCRDYTQGFQLEQELVRSHTNKKYESVTEMMTPAPLDGQSGVSNKLYEDLQLVHEVRSITVPNMLSASAESIYSFMSGRDYYRVIASVVDGSSSGPNGTAGAMLTSRIARTRFVYDGNTPTLDEYIAAHLARAQFEVGRDLCEGTIYYDFSDRPWDANSYGSLGWAITTTAGYVTTSPAYVEFCTDCLYLATQANA